MDEFNISGHFVDINEKGVRISQTIDNLYETKPISHEDFKFIAMCVKNWQEENKEKSHE